MFSPRDAGLTHENLYSPKNNHYRKNRLHSRQHPCRSPRLTVIGIGLRKISSKFCLPPVRAARRHCRCLAFRHFYIIMRFFPCIHFSCVIPERDAVCGARIGLRKRAQFFFCRKRASSGRIGHIGKRNRPFIRFSQEIRIVFPCA